MGMIEFFNEHAEHWDDDYREKDPIRDVVSTLCGANENSKVLDIGCGTGVMFPELLRLNIRELVGIDISDKMIEIAHKKFSGEPKLRIVCTDLVKFEENDFDIALMYNAYPHFINKLQTIKHVSKLLNKGGRFTIAHGSGRKIINECHNNTSKNISVELMSAEDEKEKLKHYFDVDIIIDTPYFYMISGVKK